MALPLSILPGPWQYTKAHNGYFVTYDGTTICELRFNRLGGTTRGGTVQYQEREFDAAHAQAITALPELIEALKGWANLRSNTDRMRLVTMTLAALELAGVNP